MQTLTIQTNNGHAVKLIEELVALNLIELIDKSGSIEKTQKLSERLLGSISEETAQKMHQELNQMKNEWNRDI